MRLLERGAHNYWLSQETIAQPGDGLINQIHYRDAANAAAKGGGMFAMFSRPKLELRAFIAQTYGGGPDVLPPSPSWFERAAGPA